MIGARRGIARADVVATLCGIEGRDDGAIRPPVTMASFGEIEQRISHRLQCKSLAVKVVGARQSEALDVDALAVAIVPQSQQRADVLDREAQIARVRDEAEAVHVGIGIIAIPAVAAERRRDQADRLIMADHPLRDAARLRCWPDFHSLARFNRNALVTTVKLDSAIAAPAIIGDSSKPVTG